MVKQIEILNKSKIIGITTTVPIEIIFAAGYTPVDINNLFISSDHYDKYIEIAEKDGFPKNVCSWVKGIYGVLLKNNITKVVGVLEGDCSTSASLLDVLKIKGISVYEFSYPKNRKIETMKKNITEFAQTLGSNLNKAEDIRNNLNSLSLLCKNIDELTYIDYKATGFENHLYQVSMSDCDGGNIEDYQNKLNKEISSISKRNPKEKTIKLGYIGVPAITKDLYTFVEQYDSMFTYNEVQREFAFPRAANSKDVFSKYLDYTYPYDVSFRLEEIKKQVNLRKLDALIHYTQAFCHRAIDDIVIRSAINIPILTIEGDKSNELDARTKLRIEAFLDMLHDKKEMYD